MKKNISILMALLLIISITFAIRADGNINGSKTKKEAKAEAIEILKEYNDLTDEKLAELAGLTEKEFKITKDTESKYGKIVEPEIIVRAVGCPKCGSGRMIHLGNQCHKWHTTGNQRRCTDYAFGYDVEYTRSCQATRRCESCFYEYTSEWREYEWRCHGTNNPDF